MLPAHRNAHRRIWLALVFLLPALLIAAAVLKPVPLEKDAVVIKPVTATPDKSGEKGADKK